MRILAVSDEIHKPFWDYYRPGMFDGFDLILSSGDLKAEYLSFLVTVSHKPVLYVHGNHDGDYKENPPEGCDCIDDMLITYKGVRILGLGGSRKYSASAHQYSEAQMRHRIKKLRKAIKLMGGVDIVLAHAAPLGVGDAEDLPHKGFQAFLDFIDTYHPQYLLHGHVHLNYGVKIPRQREYHGTQVINCCGHFELDCQGRELPKPGFFQSLGVKNYQCMDI